MKAYNANGQPILPDRRRDERDEERRDEPQADQETVNLTELLAGDE